MNSTLAPPAEAPLEELLDDLPQPDWDGPRCEQCRAPTPGRAMQVCACCGWYANFGIYVEVDADEAEQLRTGVTKQVAPQTFWQVWGALVPVWGWVLIGTQVMVIAASVAARLMLPVEGTMRAWWGSSQLIVGLLVAVVCHFVGFVIASADDVDMGVADVVVRPFKIWAKHIQQLPAKLTLVNLELSSLTTALCAALIVGGIPWYVLLDWKFKQPPKQNLMGAVMSHAQEVEDDKTLEEAITGFAGDATGGDEKSRRKSDGDKPVVRTKCDCLILGFNPKGDDSIEELLLAAEHNGKLIYVGRVEPQLDEVARRELRDRLEAAQTTRPFVSTTRTGTWVAPRFTCRVTFAKKSGSGRLTEIKWDELLGELNLPW